MRALGRHALAGLALAACATAAVSGRAEGGSELVLAWTAPSECPQQRDFRAQVERFLRQSLADRRQQKIDIAGTVHRQQSGDFELLLQVKTAAGSQRRELSHRDCQELTEAGALVTALAIDPQLLVEPSPSEAAPKLEDNSQPPPPNDAPTQPPPPVPAPRRVPASGGPPSDRREPPRSSDSLHPSLIALGFAGNGALPGVGSGLGARIAAGSARFRLAARGLYWFDRFQPIAGASGTGVALSSWAVGVRACGLPVLGSISLWACVGPDAGRLKGTGQALAPSRSADERWSAVTADLSLVYTASSGLMTHLGFELGKALEIPRFGISQDGREVEVFRANAWVAQASVGFGFSFGQPK
jgi:hypothetical protein